MSQLAPVRSPLAHTRPSLRSEIAPSPDACQSMKMFDRMSGRFIYAFVDTAAVPIDRDWICVSRDLERLHVRFDAREPLPDDVTYEGVVRALVIPL